MYKIKCIVCEKDFEYINKNKKLCSVECKEKYKPHLKYLVYKKGAEIRGYGFKISLEQFMEFYNKPCYYCGGFIETIGLDRLNNNDGYDYSNIVPCCNICNSFKLSNTAENYINHCKKVASRF